MKPRTPVTLSWFGPAGAGGVLALRSAAGALTPDERQTLLDDVRAGKDRRLLVDAVVFDQTEKPNKNFVRFKASALRPLAKSFRGGVFLRDHDQRNGDARGGTIIDSRFEAGGEGGTGQILQTIEMSEPWAIERVLRGTIDRFSIGWMNTGDVTCSECGEKYVRGWFGSYPPCEHYPGDKVTDKEGAEHFVEAIVSSAEGIEVSAVNVPAVAGTGIDDVRSACVAAAQLAAGGQHQGQGRPMHPLTKIANALGLAVDALEGDVLDAITRLKADLADTKLLYGAEVKAREALEARAAKAESELAVGKKSEQAAAVERLIATVRSKVGHKLGADGKPVRGGTEDEAYLLEVAETDLPRAERLAAKLPQRMHVGRSEVDPPEKKTQPGALTAVERSVAKQMGVSEEKFLAEKARLTQPAVED